MITRNQEYAVCATLMVFDTSYTTNQRYGCLEWLANHDIANNPKLSYSRQVFWFHAFEDVNMTEFSQYLNALFTPLENHIHYQDTYDFLMQIVNAQPHIHELNVLWNSMRHIEAFNDDNLMKTFITTTFFEYAVKKMMNVESIEPVESYDVLFDLMMQYKERQT